MRLPLPLRTILGGLAVWAGLSGASIAIDPPYQEEMERLSEIMGSLYFLQPLCQPGVVDWRMQRPS